MFKKLIIKIVTILTIVSFTTISADQWNYSVTATDITSGSSPSYMDFRYDDVTNEFCLEAKFTETNAADLPNGLNFALKDGTFPISHSELAFIYFDAFIPTNPQVLGYSYNNSAIPLEACAQAPGSWEVGAINLFGGADYAADPIFTTAGSTLNSGIVLSKTVTDMTVGTSTMRTFELKLDAAAIQGFNPTITPTNLWQGLQFYNQLGLWMWPVKIGSRSFDAQGLYSNYNVDSCDVIDFHGRDTNLTPVCETPASPTVTYTVGDTVNLEVFVTDEADSDLDYVLNNLPANATTNLVADSVDSNGRTVYRLDISFIATSSMIGLNSFSVNFDDNYGVKVDGDACGYTYTVVEELTGPECEDKDITATQFALDSNMTKYVHKAKKIVYRLKKRRGRATRAEKALLQQIDGLHLDAWAAVWSIPSTIVTCSTHPTCSQDSYAQFINAYTAANNNALTFSLELLQNLNDYLTSKVEFTNKKAKRRLRKLRNCIIDLNKENESLIQSIPTSGSVCS